MYSNFGIGNSFDIFTVFASFAFSLAPLREYMMQIHIRVNRRTISQRC